MGAEPGMLETSTINPPLQWLKNNAAVTPQRQTWPLAGAGCSGPSSGERRCPGAMEPSPTHRKVSHAVLAIAHPRNQDPGSQAAAVVVIGGIAWVSLGLAVCGGGGGSSAPPVTPPPVTPPPVQTAPTIGTPPSATSVEVVESASFSVVASGSGTLQPTSGFAVRRPSAAPRWPPTPRRC